MSLLGTATAYIDLDATKFKKGFEDAKSSIEGLANKFEGSSNKMISSTGKFLNSFDKIPPSIKGVGPLAVAMGATVTGAFKLGTASAKEFTQDAVVVGRTLVSMGKMGAEGLKAVVNEGVEFEQTMYQVKAITNASNDDFKTLTDTARDWGSKTRYSANEVAQAMTYLGMAGWDTTEIMDGMNGVLNLATVGNTDLALSADILSDGLTAMGMSAKEANDFADMMSATITSSNTSVALMGETMKYAGPVAGALGIEMEDLSVAIGLMGNAGVKGSQAGTALRGGLTRLIEPTKKAKGAMEEYGIEVQKTADGSVDFQATIGHLRDKLGDLDATTQASAIATIFGKEAMSGWMAVINASQDDVDGLTSKVNESTQSMQYWAKEIYGTSEHMNKYEGYLKKAGYSQDQITEKMGIASQSTAGFKEALVEMGYSVEEAGTITGEYSKNLSYLDEVYEQTMLTARGLGLSTTDLGLAMTLLGSDSQLVQKDMDSLMNSFKSLNGVSLEGETSLKKLAKGNEELGKYLKESGIEVDKMKFSTMSMNEKLDILRISTKGMTEAQKEQLFTTLGLEGEHKALNEILGLSESEYQKYRKELEETKGLTEKLAETMDQATMGSIKSMASAISDTLIEAFVVVKPHIVDFANIIGETARVLKTDGLASAVNHMVNETREKLVELPQIATDTMSYFLQAIQQTFPNILALGGDIILSLAQGIINNQEQIASTVSVVIGNIANWITNNFDVIIQAGNSLIDAVQQGMMENQEAIGTAVETFISGTTSYFLNKESSFIGIGLEVVSSIVTGAIQGLNEQIGTWTQGISDFFLRPFDTFGGQLADEALKNGKMIADKSGEGLDTSKLTFSEKFSGFMKYGLNWKDEYGQQAKGVGTKGAEGVASGFEAGKPKVGTASSNTFNQALVEATSKLDQLSPETSSALNDVCQEILNSASKMYNGAKTSFSKLGQASKESMSDMFTGIRQSMIQTENMIKQHITNAYKGGKQSFEALRDSGKSAMSDLYRGTTNSSSQMASKIIGDWNKIKGALSGTITGNVQIKVHGVQAALNQINSVKNAAKTRSFASMDNPQIAQLFALNNNDNANMYAEAFDMVRSNDVASYVSSTIPSSIKLDIDTSNKKDNKTNSRNINVEVKIDKFENKTEDSPREFADKVMDVITYKLQRKNIALGRG